MLSRSILFVIRNNKVFTRRYSSHDDEISRKFDQIEKEGNYAMRRSYKPNTILNICPQQTSWVIETLGKFNSVKTGGLHILIPFVDRIAYVFSMKEQALIIPSKAAITRDNVAIHIVGILYFQILDAKQAAYGVKDPLFALMQLAQTTLRTAIGELNLEETFKEKKKINDIVIDSCNEASKVWGIICLRHEIREIIPPGSILGAMELQMTAEREKRAKVLDSEAKKIAAINAAEAIAEQTRLNAEADAASIKIRADADAYSVLAKAKATADSIETIANKIQSKSGMESMKNALALEYVKMFGNLAQKTNSLIIPANVADVSSMIAAATSTLSSFGGKKIEDKMCSKPEQ